MFDWLFDLLFGPRPPQQKHRKSSTVVITKTPYGDGEIRIHNMPGGQINIAGGDMHITTNITSRKGRNSR